MTLSIIYGVTATLALLLAASQGYLNWYYKEVTFTREDGVAMLHKVYGPLHAMCFVYLFVYFAMMVGVICYATKRKKIATYKQAGLLSVSCFCCFYMA